MKTFGTLLIIAGFIVGLGPIAAFLFIATFPSMFPPGTGLVWHYISAFGLIVYGPAGYVLYRLGRWARA